MLSFVAVDDCDRVAVGDPDDFADENLARSISGRNRPAAGSQLPSRVPRCNCDARRCLVIMGTYRHYRQSLAATTTGAFGEAVRTSCRLRPPLCIRLYPFPTSLVNGGSKRRRLLKGFQSGGAGRRGRRGRVSCNNRSLATPCRMVPRSIQTALPAGSSCATTPGSSTRCSLTVLHSTRNATHAPMTNSKRSRSEWPVLLVVVLAMSLVYSASYAWIVKCSRINAALETDGRLSYPDWAIPSYQQRTIYGYMTPTERRLRAFFRPVHLIDRVLRREMWGTPPPLSEDEIDDILRP